MAQVAVLWPHMDKVDGAHYGWDLPVKWHTASLKEKKPTMEKTEIKKKKNPVGSTVDQMAIQINQTNKLHKPHRANNSSR